jgi:tetraacyldisaccharide 4'-kinase
MWLISRAIKLSEPVAYVSRGYRGNVQRDVVTCVLAQSATPASLSGLRLLSSTHPDLALEIGDEGAMVVERAPGVNAFFCQDKRRAVGVAAELGAARVFLDDAFQSWRVARHADIVLLDAERPLDGGALLPAGRLREKPDALQRAHAIVFNGAATADAVASARQKVARWLRPGVLVAGMARRVELEHVSGDSTRPDAFLAVSGIARPAAFERSLADAGVRTAGHEIFADHHRYDARDVARIGARLHKEGLRAVVVTEKDWVKLRQLSPPFPVWVARLEVSLIGDELPG